MGIVFLGKSSFVWAETSAVSMPCLSANFIAFKSAFEDSPDEEHDKPITRHLFFLIPLVLSINQFSSQTGKFVSAIIEVVKIPLPGALEFLFVSLEVSIAAWSAIAKFPPLPI